VADRILVVDDDEVMRLALDRSLRRLGYEVFLASDGEEGLALALSVAPQVVLTDLCMPNMDGHTLLARLTSQGTEASVVVMSAEGEMDDVVQVLRHGAVDYLKKPWTASDLIAAVSRAVTIQARRQSTHVPRLARVSEPVTEPEARTPESREERRPRVEILDTALARLRLGPIRLARGPALLARARDELAAPGARAADAAIIAEGDPDEANRLLTLVNSPVFSHAPPHRDLKLAAAKLGASAFRNAVETLLLDACFRVDGSDLVALQSRVLRFSMARALGMRALAELAPCGGTIDPEYGYSCGLLLDIGAAFLIWHVHQLVQSGAGTPTWTEANVLTAVHHHHEELAAPALARWRGGEELATVARAHHASAPPAPPTPYWSLGVLAAELAQQALGTTDPTAPTAVDADLIDRCSSDLGIGMLALYRTRDSVRAEYESLFETLPTLG
jgi:CheY-like chemotaxis protein/HD-like signal output (HDOD) protein